MKQTKKEIYENLLNDLHANNISAYDDFIAHEMELLSRKKTPNAKPTASQIYTTRLALVIRDILTKPMRVAEITANEEIMACVDDEGKAPSANKILAVLRKMKDEGEVVRTEEKGSAYFALAE